MALSKTPAEIAKEQATLAALGAGFGAVTHQTIKNTMGGRPTPIVAQVGSAMGAAAVGGAGIGGTLAAGGAVVTAKVTAGIALATATAPIVIGASAMGAIGYGLYKLFKSK
ncbi:MAG: hypothetical protein MRJ68_16505 [Nitrospira sp.]|nr:hypothetical protein [Nitrospira sp.]